MSCHSTPAITKLAAVSGTTTAVSTTTTADVQTAYLMTLNDHVKMNGFWWFIIAAILVVIVFMFLFNQKKNCHKKKDGEKECESNDLEMMPWGKNNLLLTVFLVVGLALFAWCSFVAFASMDANQSRMIALGFALSLLLLVGIFYMFSNQCGDAKVRKDSQMTAFYLSIVNLIVALVLLWFVRGSCGNFVFGFAVYAILAFVIAFYLYTITSRQHGRRPHPHPEPEQPEH